MFVKRKAALNRETSAFERTFWRVETKTEKQIDPPAGLPVRLAFGSWICGQQRIGSRDVLPPASIEPQVRRQPVGQRVRAPGGQSILIAETVTGIVASQAHGCDRLRPV